MLQDQLAGLGPNSFKILVSPFVTRHWVLMAYMGQRVSLVSGTRQKNPVENNHPNPVTEGMVLKNVGIF